MHNNNITKEEFERIQSDIRYASSNTRRQKTEQRWRDIEQYGMEYVLNRDAEEKATREKLAALKAKAERDREDFNNRPTATELETIRMAQEASLKEENQERQSFSFGGPIIDPEGEELATRVDEFLDTHSTEEFLLKFVEAYQVGDQPPIFDEFAYHDEENPKMQELKDDFNAQYIALAVKFLKEHAKEVSKPALMGYVKSGISNLTFQRIFKK